jgi:hypothetical protein
MQGSGNSKGAEEMSITEWLDYKEPTYCMSRFEVYSLSVGSWILLRGFSEDYPIETSYHATKLILNGEGFLDVESYGDIGCYEIEAFKIIQY